MSAAPPDYEEIACDFCGGTETEILYRPRHQAADLFSLLKVSSNITGTQTVVRCTRCGLTYVSPRANLALLYEAVAAAESDEYVSQTGPREATFKASLAKLRKHCATPGRVLDVGCASGSFLRVAKSQGWQVDGIEPNVELARVAHETTGAAIHPDLLSAPYADGTFDLITFWDALEHVPSPRGFLQQSADLLKEGGLLVVNYPNFASGFARVLGDRWWYMIPVHLYYFTPKVLKSCLVRLGFEVVSEARHCQSLELAHIVKMGSGYATGILKPLASWLLRTRFGRLIVPYYAGQWTIVARRSKKAVPPS
jgi:2-polyprenyl-3-methyl-5-hydroxy-6-metoxy-1,4-benzoquinol methylase